MSEPNIQVQPDRPPTLVNSDWVRWAHDEIRELRKDAKAENAMKLLYIQEVTTLKAELAELREAVSNMNPNNPFSVIEVQIMVEGQEDD